MPKINKNEMLIVGLRRSGNHPITKWILSQYQGRTCYLNDIKLKTDPFLEQREVFLPKNVKPTLEDNIKLTLSNREKMWILKKMWGYFHKILSSWALSTLKRDNLVYSYEDYSLSELFSPESKALRKKLFHESDQKFEVLILRDPFNLYASRLKRLERDVDKWEIEVDKEEHRDKFFELWKEHAKEFLGETSHLRNNKVVINYNNWFLDENYRKSIANRLNLEFCDTETHKVSIYGDGSSFDKRDFDGDAKLMKVLERWQNYKNNDYFNTIYKDKELLSLSKRIFGNIGQK